MTAAEAQVDAAFDAVWKKTTAAAGPDKMEAAALTAAEENEMAAHTRWEQAIETKEAAVARQQQYQQQQQHAQVCGPATATATTTAQKECTAATAEDDTSVGQVAAAAEGEQGYPA